VVDKAIYEHKFNVLPSDDLKGGVKLCAKCGLSVVFYDDNIDESRYV